jgi:hypothetical protein
MAQADNKQIIVTFGEIERLFTSQEAIEPLAEVAREESALETAQVMAAVGNVLRRLRRAEEKGGAPVLSTADHGPSARLQSLVASGEHGGLKLSPLPTGGLEAKFDTGDWSGWAQVAWAKLKNPTKHRLLRPRKAQAEPFPAEGRVAVLGDWGTGLYGAPLIARAISQDAQNFALVLHLGDVYYSGTTDEIETRFLAGWPARPGALSRALNSNHEMYSGGHPYFGKTLPAFGQEASYFALQNKHWTLVGLDVAYKDHAIDDEQVAWLGEIIAKAGERRVILFSHHQLYSPFESQGGKLLAHLGFRRVLDSKRIYAWYWGHEHRCILFDEPDPQFGILARCIGHGGMPQSRKATRKLPQAGGTLWNQADWRRVAGTSAAGIAIPPSTVLEGENPYIVGEQDKFSPHGYAVLAFDGPHLVEQVLDPTGDVISSRKLAGSS